VLRRLGLRSRLILIGTAGLAAGLAIGGAALVLALSLSLRHALDTSALQTAHDVSALVNTGRLPDPVPVAGAQLVQVVDASGRVRSGSPGVDRLVPLLQPGELARLGAGQRLTVDGARAGMDGPLRVLALTAGPASDRMTVIVATPSGTLTRSSAILRDTLLVAYPVFVAVLAALAWRVIGLTLRPVEALRAGAEEITGRRGEGRLPVPPAHDEIHRLAVTLNGMLDRLEAARTRQRAFVADAAHELRSPLASIRTQLEVAQRLGPAADWAELVPDLLAETERLSRLVDDLLLLARADESEQGLRVQPVELVGVLHEVAERYREARVPVSVRSPTPDRPEVWVEADPDGIRRILTNLVDNAVRHAGSAVTLAAAPLPPGDRVLVSVTDDGPGIPPDDRARAFQRFTRLDGARDRDGGGTGLGLAIVAELVRRHGGTVRLTSVQLASDQEAAGLRAEVVLPRGSTHSDG